MARIEKSTNNVVPGLVATVGCGALTIMMGPASFLLWPLLFAVGKKGMAADIDKATQKDTIKIIEEARKRGERSVTVKQTLPSNGALIDLPMTRKIKVTFDDDEL